MSRLTALKPGTTHVVAARQPGWKPTGRGIPAVESWEGTYQGTDDEGRYLFGVDGSGQMAWHAHEIVALDGHAATGMSDLEEAKHLLWQITDQCAPPMDHADTVSLIEELEQAAHDLKVLEVEEMSFWESIDGTVVVGGVVDTDQRDVTQVSVVDAYPGPSGTTGDPWLVPLGEFFEGYTKRTDL